MAKEKGKESVNKLLYSDRRFRWGILCSILILFSIILYPNLVVTDRDCPGNYKEVEDHIWVEAI